MIAIVLTNEYVMNSSLVKRPSTFPRSQAKFEFLSTIIFATCLSGWFSRNSALSHFLRDDSRQPQQEGDGIMGESVLAHWLWRLYWEECVGGGWKEGVVWANSSIYFSFSKKMLLWLEVFFTLENGLTFICSPIQWFLFLCLCQMLP